MRVPALAVAALAVLVAACRDGGTSAVGLAPVMDAAALRGWDPGPAAQVCHADEGGRSVLLDVAEPSVAAHLAHGDYRARLEVAPGLPPVPGRRFRRITDAIDAARAGRLARDEGRVAACRITIVIAAGDYVGSFDAGAAPALERFPLLLDVPDITLRGATELAPDALGRPLVPTDPGAARSLLRPDRPLAFLPVTEAMIVVVGHPLGSAGDGTVITGLTFGSVQTSGDGGMGIIALRARRLRIAGNHFLRGLSTAADLRSSEAEVAGNLTDRLGFNCGFCAAGPGRYTLRDNRVLNGGLGGLYVTAALGHVPISGGAAPPAPIEPDVLPANAEVEADVVNNEVSGHYRIPVAFALRILGLGPASAGVPQRTTVRVRDNDFSGNTFGIIVDAGFPAAGALRRGDVDVSLAGNRLERACQAPLLVALTRHTGALGVTTNPYLVNSTYRIALGGDLDWDDAWFAHPTGFGNALLVDGAEQANGARVDYDPTRTCQ